MKLSPAALLEDTFESRKLAGLPGKGWAEEAEYMITHVIYGGIPVDTRDQTVIQVLGRVLWGDDLLLQKDPISLVELPTPWGEGGGENDFEQEEHFMPCLWGLLDLVPRPAGWRERQELLRDVLDDLSDSIPSGNVDLSHLERACAMCADDDTAGFDNFVSLASRPRLACRTA